MMSSALYTEGTLTLPADNEILMQRVFRCPAETLYEVWTRPEHVRQWYGVRGTTVTVCDIDLRVGGAWRWVSRLPNGQEIAFSGVFRELDPPRRLQRTERFESVPGADSVVTLSFDQRDGETVLSMHMLFPTSFHRDMALKSGMELGVKECYLLIDKLLQRLSV